MNLLKNKFIRNVIFVTAAILGTTFVGGGIFHKNNISFSILANETKNFKEIGRYKFLDRSGNNFCDVVCLRDKKTGAHIIHKIFSKSSKETYKPRHNKLTALRVSQDDRGITHDIEHLLAPPVQNQMYDSFFGKKSENSVMTLDDFDAYTDNLGLNYKVRKKYFNEKFLKFAFKQFKNPDFLSSNSKLFEEEVLGRAYQEMVNTFETYGNDDIKFVNVRRYIPGGVPEEVKKITKEELAKQYRSYINPHNFVLFLNSNKKDAPSISKLIASFENEVRSFNNKNSSNYEKSLGQYDKNRRNVADFLVKDWPSNSNIFRRRSFDGVNKSYNYLTVVDIDVSNLSAKEKDVLALNPAAFSALLSDKFKAKGIEAFGGSFGEILMGKYSLWFACNDLADLDREGIRAFVKEVFDEFVRKYRKVKMEDPQAKKDLKFFSDINSYLDGILRNTFNADNDRFPNEYRNVYSIDSLILYSLSKYGEPFSDKVFDIEEKFDSVTKQSGVISDRIDSIKNNVSEENSLKVIEKLKNIENIDITVFKKDSKIIENYDLSYEFPVSNSVVSNDSSSVFAKRIAEYFLVSSLGDKTKGMRYNPILYAPYSGGPFRCYTNKESGKRLDKYVFENLENIKKDLISKNYNYFSAIRNFVKKLVYIRKNTSDFKDKIEILEKHLKKLELEIDSIKNRYASREDIDEKIKKLKIQNEVSLLLSSDVLYESTRKMFSESELFFDNFEEYKKYKTNKKKYIDLFESYFSSCNGEDVLGETFLRNFREYLQFEKDLFKKSIEQIDSIFKGAGSSNIFKYYIDVKSYNSLDDKKKREIFSQTKDIVENAIKGYAYINK